MLIDFRVCKSLKSQSCFDAKFTSCGAVVLLEFAIQYRALKSCRTLQNIVRINVFPEKLTLFVNTFVALKKCIIQ